MKKQIQLTYDAKTGLGFYSAKSTAFIWAMDNSLAVEAINELKFGETLTLSLDEVDLLIEPQ